MIKLKSFKIIILVIIIVSIQISLCRAQAPQAKKPDITKKEVPVQTNPVEVTKSAPPPAAAAKAVAQTVAPKVVTPPVVAPKVITPEPTKSAAPSAPEAAKKELPAAPVQAAKPPPEVIAVPEPIEEKAPEPEIELVAVSTIEEKNKEADKVFLDWKIADPYSGISPELKKILTSEAIIYLVNEAQMPFSEVLSEDAINDKISAVTNGFFKKFKPKGAFKKSELATLVREVIKPEYVFQMKKKPTYSLDKLYNKFLKILMEYITPVNTTLQEWALKFLTSESIFVALPVIKSVDVDGKSFNELNPKARDRELEPVVDLIAQRFLTNLRLVQEKFNIVIPGQMDEAIKYKIRRFLHEKFVSSFD